MKRHEKPGSSKREMPCSSHPEAETGVRIISSANRPAQRGNRILPVLEVRKPIVSVHGRDVAEIPETKERAA